MQAHTYKCPSCGAYLNFDPNSQRWVCPFCATSLSAEQLGAEAADAPSAASEVEPQVVYHCPSCGSEIVTSETTVATQCYYCHSPVVLKGRLTDDMRPDEVLPFTIDREQAVRVFMEWVKKRRFVPRGFFSKEQIESVTGVYYPHFVAEVDVEGSIDGEGIRTTVLDTPTDITTFTKHYHVRREGEMRFRELLRPALSSANRKLSDGIHPFPLDKAQPFQGAYLSGFVAERRDVDASDIRADVEREVSGYVKPLLVDDLHAVNYQGYTVTSDARVKAMRTRYVLLPTWVLTYPNRRDKAHPYYYAMNGCTGEVCGRLPVDGKRLWLTAAGIGLALAAMGLGVCWGVI